MSKLVPIGDNVIVEPIEEATVSDSGIIIPDTASKEKPMRGRVIAAGPGKMKDDGGRMAMDVNEGDVVLFSKYGPTEVKVEGKQLLILANADIYAILV